MFCIWILYDAVLLLWVLIYVCSSLDILWDICLWSYIFQPSKCRTKSMVLRGVTTLTNAVSGQSQNCSGNLEISPGTGKFFRKHAIIPGHCRKISGHRRNFYFTFLFGLTSGKLGMKSSTNETIQTASAAPRLVVYTNQSETHPTGWAHSWVPISFNHVHCTHNPHSSHVQILFRYERINQGPVYG